MRHTIQTLLLGTAILSVAACGSSKGPGEIGSREDIVIRNAGDPAPAAAPTIEPAVDPMIAEHQKAVAEAQGEIEEMAAADTDDTPVPGEPAPSPEPVEQAVVEPEPEPVIEEPVVEASTEMAGQPMARTEMDMIKPMGQRAMAAPEPDAAPAVEEPVAEPMVEEVATTAPSAAGMQPVMEGDPAVSEEMMDEAVAEPVAQIAPAAPAVSAGGLISNPDANMIMGVQRALTDKGYYFGVADGEMGAETLNALHLYQNAHGMDTFGLTTDTLDKLGVSY
ncbi:MAG: peptidoglycan-binding domain-containing protein [Pseudomonadota bacterium]